MKYRLALDLGSTSLGWAIYILPSLDLHDAGVRIFSDGRDPQNKESLAVARRGPRSARRRRDRYLQRRKFLMSEMINFGLMPAKETERKELEKLDPYFLRRAALYGKISLHHFGRILFHLNQRRGFQSNRIVDGGKDSDSGKIKEAEKKLLTLLADNNCQTYGEFLANRHELKPRHELGGRRIADSVRIRLNGEGAKAHYEFYPTRDILKNEFEKLWTSQAIFHPELTQELHDLFFNIMFFQRKLKPPIVGKCTFFPEEFRIPKAHPLSQERRIYQDLNHLKIRIGNEEPRSLTLQERDKLAFILMTGEDITVKTGLKKNLGLPSNATSSLEEGG
ncbi:MAG: hypothetical protein J0L55_15900, partial [Caulobacterales bacterium]|nr:hypothetical protein [Caulobacterales bacterium]